MENMVRKNRTVSIGLPGILTVVFTVLKLTGVIDWEWVWIASPIWISILLAFLLFLVVMGQVQRKKDKQDYVERR